MKTFRHLVLLMAAVLLGCGAASARDVGHFFASEGSKVFATLPAASRAEMLAAARADSLHQGKSTNQLGGESTLTLLDSTQLLVSTSDKSSVSMRMLTAGRDTVLAVITTVLTPLPDSRIEFYDTNWAKLPAKKVMGTQQVDIELFVRPSLGKKQRQQVLDGIDYAFVALEWKGQALVATHQLAKQLDAEQWKPLSSSLLSTVTWQVNGTRLKKTVAR